MKHQRYPEDTGLVPMYQRKVEDSGRTQSAQPEVTLRENLHTRLHYHVPKARSLAERGEEHFLGSAGENFKRSILLLVRNTSKWTQ